MIYKKLYLCDMNIDKASYQLRQSNQIMLDKRSFVRGISKWGGEPDGFSTQRAGDLRCPALRDYPPTSDLQNANHFANRPHRWAQYKTTLCQ